MRDPYTSGGGSDRPCAVVDRSIVSRHPSRGVALRRSPSNRKRVSRRALPLHRVHRRASARQPAADAGAPSGPGRRTAGGTRWAAGHRERMGHLSGAVLRLSSQRIVRRAYGSQHPAVDAGEHLRGALVAQSRRNRAQRHPEDARRRVHERPADGKHRRRRGRVDAQPVHGESAHAGSGKRPVVERLGERPRQHPLPARGCCAAHGRRRAAVEAQVGLWLSQGRDQQRSADDRFGPGVRVQRQRLHLLARCEDRLRLLVVPERIDRAQLADGRRGERAGRRAVGGVLRRRPRQRVRARRADRPAALEGSRGRPRRGAHHRRREVPRGSRLRADLRLRGVQQRQQGLPVLHGARRGGGARCEYRQGNLEDVSVRTSQAVEEAGQWCAAVRTRDRRRVGFADDRSCSRRTLRRHWRCGDAAGVAAHRRRARARSEDRQGALGTPFGREGSVHGRLRRTESQRGVSRSDGTGLRHRQLADPRDAARTASVR